MNAIQERTRGVLGMSKALPNQGAVCETATAGETKRQSCPTDSSRHSAQFRIRLPARHAKRWQALPPKLREHVAGVVFGAYTADLKLEKLVSVESELRLSRTAINNALQFALARGASLDTKQIEVTVARIDHLLGGKP